jgi:hypothetical protein
MGAVTDMGVDLQAAEEEIERQWSKKRDVVTTSKTPVVEFKGEGIGASEKGREKVL